MLNEEIIDTKYKCVECFGVEVQAPWGINGRKKSQFNNADL